MFTFNKTKYALISLNTVYFLAGVGLLYICASAKFSNPPSEFKFVRTIIINNEVLSLVLAVIGIYAVFRHHQVIMFFYIIIFSILLILEVELSLKLLRSSSIDQAGKIWDLMKSFDQNEFIETNRCYRPYDGPMNSTDVSEHTSSIPLPCSSRDADCLPCVKKLASTYESWNNLIGYWVLGCNLAKVPGVVLTRHYRNLKDPRSHSSAFL